MPDRVAPFSAERFEPDMAPDRLVQEDLNARLGEGSYPFTGNGTGAVLDRRTGFYSDEEEAAMFWALAQTMSLYNP
jgi:hypothetical protein